MARERKIKVEIEGKDLVGFLEKNGVTSNSVEVKPRWKVLSGGITLLDKRSFSKGDEFEAYDWEVSKSVRDIVKCITPEILAQKTARAQFVYSLEEIVPTAEEQDDENFVQSYNIVNQNGKVISTGLAKEVAEPLLKELNR